MGEGGRERSKNFVNAEVSYRMEPTSYSQLMSELSAVVEKSFSEGIWRGKQKRITYESITTELQANPIL